MTITTHTAVVHPDGQALITGPDGRPHQLRTSGTDDARTQIINHLTAAARDAGTSLLAQTTDQDGTQHLRITPDGAVSIVQAAPEEQTPAPMHDSPTVEPTPLAEPDDQPATAPAVPAAAPQQVLLDPPAQVPGPPAPQVRAADDAADADQPVAGWTRAAASRPTLDDLIAARPPAPTGPAQQGWRASLSLLTGGLIAPGPGVTELEHRDCVSSVQRSLDGPKTVVVVNPKGGGTKTTATIMLAATFGIHRGGYTLAWDNNETRGTLGWRAAQARHTNTAVDLLRDLDRFTDIRSGRVGDLDNYVRSQGSAQFDVLASDEDAASAASIDADAFNRLHHTLARFYRVLVVDTGNNMRASNWQAAVEAADQLVIVSTVREDTAQSAAWLIDGLRATGQSEAVERAVTVLTAPARTADPDLSKRLHDHFGQLTRTVLDVPHDPVLVPGGPIAYDALSTATQRAWLRVSAAVAEGL